MVVIPARMIHNHQLSLLLFLGALCFVPATATISWADLTTTAVAAAAPSPRREHAADFIPSINALIVFGGQSSSYLDDTWLFFVGNSTWVQLFPTARPAARKSMISGVFNTTFVVSIGEGVGRVFFNDVWALDLSNIGSAALTWVEMTPLSSRNAEIPEIRYGAAGGVSGHHLLVSHGFSNERYSNSWQFDLATREWTKVFAGTHPYAPHRPHARCLMGFAIIPASSLVMFGGCLSGGLSGGPCPSFDTWLYRSGDWTELGRGPAPRQFPAMVHAPLADCVLMHGGIETGKQMLAVGRCAYMHAYFVRVQCSHWRTAGTVTQFRV